MTRTRRVLFTVLTFGLYRTWRRRKYQAILKRRRHQANTLVPEAVPPRRAAFAQVAGLFALGAAAGYSTQSKAISADSIASVVTDKMQGMLKGLLGQLWQMITQFWSGQNDKIIAAQAKAGDATRNTMLETHNQDVLRETEPPPNACRSAELGEAGQEASENTAIGSARDDVRQTVYYNNMTPSRASLNRKGRVKRRIKRHGDKSAKPHQDTSAAFLSQTQLSEEDKKTAKGFADNVMGESRYLTLALDNNVVGNDATYRYEDKRATLAARRSVAMLPINRAVNRRVSQDGKTSEQDILHEEINRTYGNSQWRKELNEKAAPTPVLKEIANMTAVSNKIQLTQLERIEESNLLLSTLVLEMLERPERKKAMDNDFVAANNPHAKRDKR